MMIREIKIQSLLTIWTFSLLSSAQVAYAEDRNNDSEVKQYLQESNELYHTYRKAIVNDRVTGEWVGDALFYKWVEGGRIVHYKINPTQKTKIELSQEDFKGAKKMTTKPASDDQRRPNTRESPDGKWVVKFSDYNLSLVDRQTQNTAFSTSDGTEKSPYQMVIWSPDSSRFLTRKNTIGQRRVVTIVESSPKDQVQPKLHQFGYDKPGDRVDQQQPKIFFIDGGEPMIVDPKLIENHFMLRNYSWRNNHQLTFEYLERGYGKHHVILLDSEQRSQRVLIREDSDTFVHLGAGYRSDLDGGNEIIWKSERDGWDHLYLYDGVKGEMKNQITNGEFVVHSVVHVDENKRKILFIAGGENVGEDPYHKHHYWINFDGSGLKKITGEGFNHRLNYSPDYRYAMKTSQTVQDPPRYSVIDAQTGEELIEIGKCNDSALKKAGWIAPEPFVSKDRDDKFLIYGNIYRPRDFDLNKKYPVIELIYAGPQDHYVDKNFNFWNVSICELTMRGFIVVQIDGKGTHKRCREFSHFSYKNLGDSGLPDRVKWIKAAAEKYPQMDTNRVGIFGGSAGGQSSTAALLAHGDFYKVAVSDCGCHDNRMDKIWWNEQWMDWPIGPHYAEQSNVTNAHKLAGKLLLTVGEIDNNVDPASTMQVADALIKADKEFKLIVFPSMGHGAGDSGYGRYARYKFFKDNL